MRLQSITIVLCKVTVPMGLAACHHGRHSSCSCHWQQWAAPGRCPHGRGPGQCCCASATPATNTAVTGTHRLPVPATVCSDLRGSPRTQPARLGLSSACMPRPAQAHAALCPPLQALGLATVYFDSLNIRYASICTFQGQPRLRGVYHPGAAAGIHARMPLHSRAFAGNLALRGVSLDAHSATECPTTHDSPFIATA